MSIIDYFASSPEKKFSALVKPHLQNMYRQAYRLTSNQDDAEDLVQETLTHVYEKKVDLAEIEKLSSWLLRSLYNLFVDNYRKKNRLPIDDKDSDSDAIIESIYLHYDSPHHIFESRATEHKIKQAIATLNPEQQAIIALHDMEGFTLTEISEITDTPVGTLKSRLHRGRNALRESLQSEREELEPFESNKRLNV